MSPMFESISETNPLYAKKPGGVGYCGRNMRPMLEELGFERALEHLETVMALQEKAIELRYHWKQGKSRDMRLPEGTQELDDKIDGTVSSLVEAAQAFTNLPDDSDKCQCAEQLLDGLFPEGVFPITSSKFTEQHADVEHLIEKMNGEYADHVDTLGIRDLVDQLASLNDEFGRRLEPDEDGVSYDEVQAARKECEEAFNELVAMIIGKYATDLETLNEILEPVHEIEERTRRYMKRRGTIPEIDEENGEPVEDGGEPTEPTDSQDPTDGDGESTPEDPEDDGSPTPDEEDEN